MTHHIILFRSKTHSPFPHLLLSYIMCLMFQIFGAWLKKKSTYFSSRLAWISGGHEDTRTYTRSLIFDCEHTDLGFPGVSVSKESACNAGDPGSVPGLGRSPGVGNSNPLHYSCLENPTDRGAWWTTAHGVTRVWHDRITNHHMLTYFAFQIKFAFPLFIILITLWVLYY